MEQVLRASAKVNLSLSVVGYDRGYHDLQSLVGFIDCFDILRVSYGFGGVEHEIVVEPDSVIIGDNLLRRVLGLVGEVIDLPILRIVLRKHIPLGSGLGGASADAAALLDYCVNWHGLPESCADRIGSSVGSDIQACRYGGVCWLEGRGDRISPVFDCPELACLVLYCGVELLSERVFSRYRSSSRGFSERRIDLPDSFLGSADLFSFLLGCGNDLWDSARSLCPELSSLRDYLLSLEGVGHVVMSGSGSCLLALWPIDDFAYCCAGEDELRRRGYFAQACRFNSGYSVL